MPLISKVAKTLKPVIISTGMANQSEIKDAIQTVRENGNENIIVLHCTSACPTPIEETNLSTIQKISDEFDVLVGLSDHSMGTKISCYACLLGSCLIEKHFTLDRSKGGVDSNFSLEPKELSNLVSESKSIKSILGLPSFHPTKSESSSLSGRRSLYAIRDIKKGEIFTKKNIKSIRPGRGMKPKYIDKILGLKAKKDINFGDPLSEEMIAEKN